MNAENPADAAIEAARIALEWRMMARKNEDRAERAEAERDVEYRKYAQEADRAETLEAEVAELRATIAAVQSVCQNTDGDWLDGGAEIPVGEVVRMLTLDGTRALDGAGEQQ